MKAASPHHRRAGARPATKFEPAATETYLSSLTYDEQGKRRRMVLGNGVATEYEYYAESQRLMALNTQAPGRLLLASLPMDT